MSKFLCGECIHNSDKGGGCLIPKNLGYVDNCNHYLPKDRPIVQTNEEYLRSCNTEQLAEWLLVHMDCIACPASCEKCHRYYDACKETILEWLKQPHKDGES